ncbi:COG4223 family protein [Bartonella sp. F02]|uniref:COG4223 family protein n=1 Tax=Bartonella sp. F02 TaxID=2967262 RepID=UPI002E798B5C|nr:hypothetical protein [Bartonella sp. F02]
MAEKPKAKSHYTGGRRKAPVIEHKTVESDEEETRHSSTDSIVVEKQNKPYEENTSTVSCISKVYLLMSGVIGGFIALGFGIGLQKSGFFPSSKVHPSRVHHHMKEERVFHEFEVERKQLKEVVERYRNSLPLFEDKIENVTKEIETLKEAFHSFSSQPVKFFQKDKTSQEEYKRILSNLAEKVDQLTEEFEAMKSVKSFKEEKKESFSILEEKVAALEEHMQTFVNISKEMNEVLLVGQNNINDLSVLKQQLNTIQEEIAAKSHQKDETKTAKFIAINALKNAVDRGGSYVDELKMLQNVLPSDVSFDLLQKTAHTGLPTSARLSANFANVADTIVRTQNIAAPDAGFSEQIWMWIKNLVVSRPIGDVEGATLGAIVARMEVAIQAGDYQKALTEWQTLPQNAQDVSIDFMRQLEQNLAVQNALQKLLISVQ